LTSDKLQAYREERIKRDHVSDATVDRETSVLHIAYHRRKAAQRVQEVSADCCHQI